MKLNNAKKAYKAAMKDQIDSLPVFPAVEATFILYPGTKRLTDIGNVLSIHEKFFMDALVEAGKLEDDNYQFHRVSHYCIGYVDKVNPRVEIVLQEVEPKKLKDFII